MKMLQRMPAGVLPFVPGSPANALNIEEARNTGDLRRLGIQRTDTGEAHLWQFPDTIPQPPHSPEAYQKGWANIFRFCEGYPILSFNATSDYDYIENHLKRNKIYIPFTFQRVNWKELTRVANICFPENPSHNLESFFRNAYPDEKFNRVVPRNAEQDAIILGKCWNSPITKERWIKGSRHLTDAETDISLREVL